MRVVNSRWWGSLEPFSSKLFLIGFALELIFAINHGLAHLFESVSFIEWIYPAVLLGRLAVLVGLAGLSLRIIDQYPRFGGLARGVLSLAALFTIGLLSLSLLDILGGSTSIIAVFGVGTVSLTMLTFLLFGVAGFLTDAYSTVIGGLLLVVILAMLFVLVGQGTFSTNIRGAVGEGVNAVVFLAIWYRLRTEIDATRDLDPTPEAVTE